MADYLRKFAPGDTVTYGTSAAVTGGQLVTVSGNGLVAPTAGPGVVEGVASRDATSGQLVAVFCGGVHVLTASAAITAGQRVQSAAAGAVAPWAGTAPADVIGHATEAIAAGAAGRVRLYS